MHNFNTLKSRYYNLLALFFGQFWLDKKSQSCYTVNAKAINASEKQFAVNLKRIDFQYSQSIYVLGYVK